VFEPEVVLAASPRDWAQRLVRHVADHGGARVRATVLHPTDALAEACHVFVADDTTTFLSARLVEDLHRAGRLVLGVHDPEDPRGKGDLLELGVDEVIPRNASAAQFLTAVGALAARTVHSASTEVDGQFAQLVAHLDGSAAHVPAAAVQAPGSAEPPGGHGGRVVVVSGTSGGVGTTEVALAVAVTCAQRGERTVLVDADAVHACLAQRLGAAVYPNLRAAVDAVEGRAGSIGAVLQAVPGTHVALLPGLASGRAWSEVRPVEAVAVVDALRSVADRVVVDAGPAVEDLPTGAGPPRYGVARQLIGVADTIVGVAPPTPVGVARLLGWAAEVQSLAPATPIHVALNPTPASLYKRGQVTGEITRSFPAARLWYLPRDSRVDVAAWDGTVVAAGPFTRAVAALVAGAVPAMAGTPTSTPTRAPGRSRRR
jgi:hypothetical protein